MRLWASWAAAVGFALWIAAAAPVSAEIVVLANGSTLKVGAWVEEGESVRLALRDGGEVGVARADIAGFVPDEVLDAVCATAETPGPPRSHEEIRRLATEIARQHGVDPALVLAVIGAESAFRVDAVSPKGAQGLMQLMPATAAELGVADAFDPGANVGGGVRHLEALLKLYGGDRRLALAAYNAGTGAVARHGGVPPYRETRRYVRRVLSLVRQEEYPGY